MMPPPTALTTDWLRGTSPTNELTSSAEIRRLKTHDRPVGRKWNGGVFGKKVENGDVFSKKWTFPQRRVHYVQIQYFSFYILLIWAGGAYAPDAPPCLRTCTSFRHFFRSFKTMLMPRPRRKHGWKVGRDLAWGGCPSFTFSAGIPSSSSGVIFCLLFYPFLTYSFIVKSN